MNKINVICSIILNSQPNKNIDHSKFIIKYDNALRSDFAILPPPPEVVSKTKRF